MVRFIRLSLNEKRPFFMVRTPDNWEAESRKSPEYQGKTAQKLAQYGLKAARRAPQFSKRWSRLQNAQKPWKLNGFRGFSFCPVLAQPDPTKSFLPGTTRGQLPFFRLYGTTSGTTTGTTFRHFGVTISALILPISFIWNALSQREVKKTE